MSGILFGSCLGAFGAPKQKAESVMVEFPFVPLPADKVYANTKLSPEERAAAVVKEMTFEEKAQSLGGFQKFYTPRIERLGIRPLYLSDASQGVHIRTELNTGLEKSTAFPCTLALAATWNPDLAGQYASALGEQCRAGDIAILLGPGLNIYRSSTCGRNFEYMGEDPYLVGQMASSYVIALQEKGVMSTLKHFVCNNSEELRTSINSIVSERALNEIYLPAFRRGIEAGSGAVMTSYNAVNGHWCGQSKYVNTDLLRKQMGFQGLVMSDWGSVRVGDRFIESGADLCMPDFHWTPKKEQEAELDRMIITWLTSCFRMGFYDRPQKDPPMKARFKEHEAVALKTAQESVILLNNKEHILPLDKIAGKKILLVGKSADRTHGGLGSGGVKGYDAVSLRTALDREFPGMVTFEAMPTDDTVKSADLVIVAVATREGEKFDRDFELVGEWGKGLAERCVGLNTKTIVVGISGGGFRMTGFSDKAAAIVLALYGGQTQGTAIVDVLAGRVNPSGKLPFTLEREFADSPASVYPLVKGPEEKGGKPEAPTSSIDYKEGVFVGYRWYESKKIEPLFPFGFGLSYTTFKYDDLKLSSTKLSGDDVLKVSFTITNTGKVAGAEVAQLYVQPTQSSVPRPVKELKGFKKVMLNPGESAQVELNVTRQDLSFWDETSHNWKAEPGQFNILVGSSSADVRLNGALQLEQ
jgi:beta-glucosidase